MAKKNKEKEKRALLPADVIRKKRQYYRQMSDVRSFFTHLCLMAVLIYLMFFVIFGISPVKNDDMKPKLSAGDLMLYYRLYDTEAVRYPITLKEDEYFLMADMRSGAKDSRLFGAVKLSEIEGKVITILRRSSL